MMKDWVMVKISTDDTNQTKNKKKANESERDIHLILIKFPILEFRRSFQPKVYLEKVPDNYLNIYIIDVITFE